jgi:hypothetical protein
VDTDPVGSASFCRSHIPICVVYIHPNVKKN